MENLGIVHDVHADFFCRYLCILRNLLLNDILGFQQRRGRVVCILSRTLLFLVREGIHPLNLGYGCTRSFGVEIISCLL